jgi:hypothetical protein
MFYIKQYLPILRSTVSYKELTNTHYFELLKYINNSDDRGIAEYFDEIINTHIKEPQIFTVLEKFLILFDLRSICIGDSVELKLKNNATAKLSIFSMLESIKKRISDISFKKSVVVNDFTLNLTVPRSFIVDKDDDVYESVIESVHDGSTLYNIDSFSKLERSEFYKSLPANVFSVINAFIVGINNQLKGINIIYKNDELGIDEVQLSIFDNTLFSLLKLLYRDDLMNFYEQQYSFIRKMQFTQDHFMKMTPNESRLYINLFNKENENFGHR